MKIERKQVKSIVTKSNLPEADYVINPYGGCQHACKYCYADFMRRFTGHANDRWGEYVDIKENGPDTIKNIKEGATILVGSVTDPYQPIESTEQITRKCLEKLVVLQPRLEILTKSPLILRDIDLLKKFKNLKVGMSIGILNESYARQLEPYVPSPQHRIEALRRLHSEGISTYLFMSPIFPEISEITPLLDQVNGIVDEVFFENLNIRGNNKRNVMEFIEKNRPDLRKLYEGINKDPEYWQKLKEEIEKECVNRNLKHRFFFHHGK
jgi:DNA repair photolyase